MSRSSRVRKKSTKLADFESSEDIDIMPKRKSPTKSKKVKQQPKALVMDSESSNSMDSGSDIDIKDDSMEFPEDWVENVDPESLMDDEDDDDDEDTDEDDVSLSSKDDNGYASQANSLYFSEKRKSAALEATRQKRKKLERKDKGKARFTAYMLWARNMRPKIVQEQPMMDFAGINKRLGEMWNLVPYTQKHNWKRKAKKLQTRAESGKGGSAMISTGKKATNVSPKRTPMAKSNVTKGKLQSMYESKSPRKDRGRGQALASIDSSVNVTKKEYQSPKTSKLTNLMEEIGPPSLFKVTGTSPIDVAAHLKLLGESLNNIGQKLKEHEGQIAVSGSLSVLLDSMLCVLGPLACLSNQLDETRGAIPETTLNGILDNIAYIMPGIV